MREEKFTLSFDDNKHGNIIILQIKFQIKLIHGNYYDSNKKINKNTTNF